MRYVWMFLLLLCAGCSPAPQDPPPSLLAAETPVVPGAPRLVLDGWSGCMVRDRATLELYVELRDEAGQVYLFRVLDDGTLRYAPEAYTSPSRDRVRPQVLRHWDKLEVSW